MNTQEIKIRKLASSDASAAAKLLKEVISELSFYSKESIKHEIAVGSPEKIRSYMKNEPTIFLGAWSSKKLAGLLLAYINKGGLAFVDWIVVDPEYRRMGIAKKLVREAEHIAKRKGMHKMWWDTEMRNNKMNAFNKKMGYRVVATLKDWHYHDNRYLWAKSL